MNKLNDKCRIKSVNQFPFYWGSFGIALGCIPENEPRILRLKAVIVNDGVRSIMPAASCCSGTKQLPQPHGSKLAAVVSPVQKSLPLSWTARPVTPVTGLCELAYMPPHFFPAFDLPLIIGTPAPHIIPAIPLEPPTRVLLIKPTLLHPVRPWF